jgi:hypothetical protein
MIKENQLKRSLIYLEVIFFLKIIVKEPFKERRFVVVVIFGRFQAFNCQK